MICSRLRLRPRSKLMKFRKKPVIVEAKQLYPSTRQSIKDWCGDAAWFYDSNGESELYVASPEETYCAGDSDWIVKNSAGEFSVCTPDRFAATYEAIE